MTGNITTIGFDADDTLWHNESFFRLTQGRFAELFRDYAAPDHLVERLAEAEVRNLGHYGFGIKGFVLSMIETAIEVTNAEVPATVIAELIAVGREMLVHPIDLLPGAEKTVIALKGAYRLVLITKGDLLDQERKLAQSGLGDHFHAVEIVSDKTRKTYVDAFARHGSGPGFAVMVGNSLKSDIIPALQAGSWALHVPHDLTWAYERADPPVGQARFRKLSKLRDLPQLLGKISQI